MTGNDNEDAPLFELKVGAMSLGRGLSSPQLTLAQRQELIDSQLPAADLSTLEHGVENGLNSSAVLAQYTPEERAILKAALAKECFRVWGKEDSKIEGIIIRPDNGHLEAKVDHWFYASVDPKKVLAEHKVPSETPVPLQKSIVDKLPAQAPEATVRNDHTESVSKTVQGSLKAEPEQIYDPVTIDSRKPETLDQSTKSEAMNTQPVPDQHTVTAEQVPEKTPEHIQPVREDAQPETPLPESSVSDQKVIQEEENALNERDEQKIQNIDEALAEINKAQTELDYWEDHLETIAADTARFDELMLERQALYDLMNQPVNEQPEYFRNQKDIDSNLASNPEPETTLVLDNAQPHQEAHQAEPPPLSEQMKLSDSTDEATTSTENQSTETITTTEPNELTPEELTQFDQDLRAIDEKYSTRVRIVEEDPTLLDSVKKNALDTFDTSAALLETAAKETVNFGTKIGANVGATVLGAIHGVREGSLDEGISAMHSVRDETMGRYRIESSDFAKEQLSQSAIAEIGAWVQEKGEAAYSAIEEKYGTNVAELVKGSLGAGLDIAGVLSLSAVAKTGQRAIHNQVTDFRYEQIPHNPNIAHHIKNVEGFNKKSGISGGHNKDDLLQGLKDHNLDVVSESKPVKGISEITYGREKVNGRGEPDGFKTYDKPKTVYDPDVYSDKEIFQIGKEAALKGYKKAILDPDVTQYTKEVNGVKFRIYLDDATREVRSFHPTLKGE